MKRFAGKFTLALAMFLSPDAAFTIAHAQGALTPPGAPAATMKSLDQVEPRTPVNTLPGDSTDLYLITRPGSYYLTTNIVVTGAASAIGISASDVSLDLNGFTIYGPASQNAIRSLANNLGRVQVRNGNLVGWAGGLEFFVNGQVTNLVVENVQMNLTNGGAAFYAGIDCGDGLSASRCSISGANGPNGYAVSAGDRSLMESCSIFNCNAGVAIGSYATVRNCMVKSCPGGYGVSAGSTSILRNNLVDGCKDGMDFRGPCEVSQNTCQDSTGNGFNISGNYSRIEDNQAVGNAFFGFICQGLTTNNVIVRNVARGNSSGNFVINATDALGAIINTSGTITNLNPWANFSY